MNRNDNKMMELIKSMDENIRNRTRIENYVIAVVCGIFLGAMLAWAI